MVKKINLFKLKNSQNMCQVDNKKLLNKTKCFSNRINTENLNLIKKKQFFPTLDSYDQY